MKKITIIIAIYIIGICLLFSAQPQLDMTLTLFQNRQDMSIIYGVTALSVPYPVLVDNLGRIYAESNADIDKLGGNDITNYEGAIANIPFSHYKKHNGDAYFASDIDIDVDDGTSVNWYMTTPASATGNIHLTYQVKSSVNGTMGFYEDCVFSVEGSSRTAYNSFRTSGLTLEYMKDGTISSLGTRLIVEVMGTDGTSVSKGASGATTGRDKEIILKADTVYAVIFTSETDNCRVSIDFDFYLED